jgi:hypothetical protein
MSGATFSVLGGGGNATMGTAAATPSPSLARLTRTMAARAQAERVRLYERYHGLYDVARQYLAAKKRLLFGGYAINALLPPAARFYDAWELPDLDAMTPDAAGDAARLAEAYKRRGHAFVEVRSGMHPDTVKLFVEFQPVADLHQVPLGVYRRLQAVARAEAAARDRAAGAAGAGEKDAAALCFMPTDFLRMAMHHELSEPQGHVARWTKVYARLRLFLKAHPRVVRAGEGAGAGAGLPALTALDADPVTRTMIDAAHAFAVAKRLPLVGQSAVFAMLLQGDGRRAVARALRGSGGGGGGDGPVYRTLDRDLAPVAMLSEAAQETVELLREALGKAAPEAAGGRRAPALTVKRSGEHAPALPGSDHHVPHYVLRLGRQAIAAVHQSVACHAVVEAGAAVYGNVDTVLKYLYHYLLVPVTPAADAAARCLIQLLYGALDKAAARARARARGRGRGRGSTSRGAAAAESGVLTTPTTTPTTTAAPLLERFGLQCYGYHMSVNTAKRARAQRRHAP